MVKEYIERNALLKDIAELKRSPWYNDDYGFGIKQARHEAISIVADLCIEQAPVVDAVEVIRCKNCKYAEFNSSYSKYKCTWIDGRYRYSNDFCSYGCKRGN